MSLNLNPDLIRRANDASMFDSGSVLAREAERVYAAFLPGLEPLPEHTDEQRAYLARRADEWCALVEKAYNDNLARRAGWVSVMVAGPSNYPAHRMNKRADAAMNAANAWDAKFDSFKSNTAKTLRALEPAGASVERYRQGCSEPIPSGDPLAREKLAARLDHLKDTQAHMVALNAHYRKHKTCVGFEGLSDDAARAFDERIEKDYSWNKQPYPSCTLSNNNANIKRISERLAALRKAREVQADAALPVDGDGFRVVRNAEACRVQILFDEKPDEATRALLKRNGFRWAPSVGAWQRMLNANGVRAADAVVLELGR